MSLLRSMAAKSRHTYDCLMAAQKAHAKWEHEVSSFILTRRWKLLLALLVPVVIFVGLDLAFAADLPASLGGKKSYMPSYATMDMFLFSILIGLAAGLITGCIGAGGGFILTPALMSIGVKGIMSVGTDQFHIFAKAIMGTAVHRKLGNVSIPLAVCFVAGSFCGVTLGGMVNRGIYEKSPALSDAFISAVYVFMLGFLGVYALYDYLRLRKGESTGAQVQTTTSVARALQAANIPPKVRFDEDVVPGGRSISIYPVIVCGFIVGFVAAIMGVGGGFLTFPMFVYGLGVSTFTTVGTDILQIIFTAGYASIFQYAIYGFVFYTIAMGMLVGSLVGIQIGALTTKLVKGAIIRGFYAVVILAGFVNRAFALPGTLQKAGYIELSKSTANALDLTGLVIFFALVGIFGLWVLAAFFRGLGQIRAGDIGESAGVGH